MDKFVVLAFSIFFSSLAHADDLATRFTFSAAAAAFETATAPLPADLSGDLITVGIANRDIEDQAEDGYWPDGKLSYPGYFGFFNWIIQINPIVNPFGNQAFSFEKWLVGFESGKIYRHLGKYDGALKAASYQYVIPGGDTFCRNVVECKTVPSNKMLLCAERVEGDSSSVCPEVSKTGIYRFEGLIKKNSISAN